MIICTLNQLMIEKGVTQSKLSEESGITRPTLLSLIRNDNQSIRYETINQLCKFFSIDMSELLRYSPVNVTLLDILVERLFASDEGLQHVVSVIYDIDGHEIEFDTNLIVSNTKNSLENSGKFIFGTLIEKTIWSQMKIKKFDKDFIKVYNDAINLEGIIKEKLKDQDLNTNFQIKEYDIDIRTFQKDDRSSEDIIKNIEKMVYELPNDKSEKQFLINSIKTMINSLNEGD